MKSRIEDVPKLKTEPSHIEGPLFNQARLALLRLENPLRLRLPGLRGMDVLLDAQAWVCVDRTLYDLPVLAWTNFDQSNRGGLHKPVRCLLHYYHIHADLISRTILETVNRELNKRLRQYREEKTQVNGNDNSKVIPINNRS
jgi:hypothetical protein